MNMAHEWTPTRRRWMLVLLATLLLPLLFACSNDATTHEGAAGVPASQSNADTDERADAPDTGGSAERSQEAPAEQEETTEEFAREPEAEIMEETEAEEEMALSESDMAVEGDAAVGAAPMPAAPPPGAPAPTQAASAPTTNEDIAEQPEPIAPEPVEVNPYTSTADDALSTFAMDVDTASYSAARNYITNGTLPPPAAVRVEEFVNYFRYAYPDVEQGAFAINIDATPSPYSDPNTYIARVGIQGERIDNSQRDDAMLTFVIDISGSMAEPNRLPLVKDSLQVLLEQLRDTDQVAIVVYSDDTRVVLEHTPVAQRATIIDAIDSLEIEGATNVEGGLQLAYQQASRNFQNGAINRVILCSDGVANVGATGPDEILQSVRDYAAQGIVLTTVGFGMGDFNDHLMEQLANDGDGNYAYVDTMNEARRVFVEDLTGTLQVIARDAKIQVDFNPEVVSQYRLLGYENRAVADEDFRNDEVDAGEVGAGHSVTALYELRLTEQGQGTALVARVRYEDPESGEVAEIETPLESSAFAESFEDAPANMQLAVAAAGFAEYLRGSGYVQQGALNDIMAIAERVAPEFANDTDVEELISLIQQVQTMQ